MQYVILRFSIISYCSDNNIISHCSDNNITSYCSDNIIVSYCSDNKIISYCSDNSIIFCRYKLRTPLVVCVWGLCRRGQIMFAATVHRQALSASPRSHNWRRVWSAYDQHRQSTDEASDLGYGESSRCDMYCQ